MRHSRWLLQIAGLVGLGALGCKPLPELKPPPQVEVLSAPDEKEKRYILPVSYPASAMDNDPLKQKAKQDAVIPARAGPRPPGMGGM